jgi:hypothetical protein
MDESNALKEQTPCTEKQGFNRMDRIVRIKAMQKAEG